MGFKSDIEIAQEAKPQDIREIAKKLGLTEDDLELYGCLLYTSPSPRDLSTSRMPSSA